MYSDEEKYILPNYDWQIYIPAKKRTISFSNIVSPQQERHCFGDCGCVNPISSFDQDGQVTLPQYGTVPNFNTICLAYVHE